MGAIFGVISKNGNHVSHDIMDKVQQCMSHRAIDGSAMWIYENVGMGHCSLKIYPHEMFEVLPEFDDQYSITTDARLFNRKELAASLGIDPWRLTETSDSRLILLAFKKWGKNCVDHLDGEYAFAIWNKISRSFFAATDHIGFRIFYYCDTPEDFIFCSEIKGILPVKKFPNYFNDESLLEYYFRKSDPSRTFCKGIFALCGGNALSLEGNFLTISKYWDPKPRRKFHFKNDCEWNECLRELLFKAVEKRLNSDVPVGILLSGGLDSTGIACILSNLLMKKNKSLYAFSSVLPMNHQGIESDERNYIEMVGKYCPNLIQTWIDGAGLRPLAGVEEAFDSDEQFPNNFFYMDRALLKAAEKEKIRILFTGYGGDHWVSWKGSSVIFLLAKIGESGEAWGLVNKFSQNEGSSVFRVLKDLYFAQTNIYRRLQRFRHRNSFDWQVYTTLRDDFTAHYKNPLDCNLELDNSKRMLKIINSGKEGRILSSFYNRNGFFGMDSATPLLDRALIEFLMDVPLQIFVQGGYRRSFFRHALDGLMPSKIQWRKDKSPYDPGYLNRIMKEKATLSSLISFSQNAFIFEKYLDKKKIIDHFDEVLPEFGFTSGRNIVGIRIMQAGISCIAINYLKSKGFQFD